MKFFVLFIALFLSFSAFADDRPRLELRHMVINMPNDVDCVSSFVMAEKLASDDPKRYKPDSYRFVGLYFVDEGICQVYDIIYLETPQTFPHSAHEVLETIFVFMQKANYLHDYEFIQNGKAVRLYERKPVTKT